MIVEKAELHEIELLFDRVQRSIKLDEKGLDSFATYEQQFFVNRPHLLMLLGFDEFRVLRRSKQAKQELYEYIGSDAFPGNITYESIYRQSVSGMWQLFEGIVTGDFARKVDGEEKVSEGELYLHFMGYGKSHEVYSALELISRVRQTVTVPDIEKRVLVFPKIWTPRSQLLQRLELAETTHVLLRAIYDEERSLREIPWRRLEELIAELLRARGMEIYVTSKTHDGGRDIIARGELIPGEPTLLAVEVKQKAVVGLADVQRALRANEDFPSLLLSTAGRFSAGVIRERTKLRNQLRLFLKDGVAIAQWIQAYGLRQGWTEKFQG